jgi:hypothetical protein
MFYHFIVTYLFLESIFVGFYTVFIYILLNFLFFDNNNIPLQIFITGFMKHLLGYFTGIQTYYCKYGYACINNKYKSSNISSKAIASSNYLLLSSILEGICFIIVYYIIYHFIKKSIFIYFLIGFFLHIFADVFGIHKLFCKYLCK